MKRRIIMKKKRTESLLRNNPGQIVLNFRINIHNFF